MGKVDFERSVIHVLESVTRGHRGSPKGKRGRSVPMAPTVATALLDLQAVSPWDEVVFACPSTGVQWLGRGS